MEPASPHSPCLPTLTFLAFVWSWVQYWGYQGMSILCTLVDHRAVLTCITSHPVWLYSTGFVSHWTTTFCLHLRFTYFVLVTNLTGTPHLIRPPNQLPHLIARPSSRDLKVFTLTPSDIHHIHASVGIHAHFHQGRKWRPEWRVRRMMGQSDLFTQPPVAEEFDFSTCHLVGPQWTQGLGVVGHGICVALLEEFGRWPNDHGAIACRIFSWKDNQVAIAKIPISFVMVPGVEEMLEQDEVRIRIEWQELGAGMTQGPIVSAVVKEEVEPLDFEEEAPPLLPMLS